MFSSFATITSPGYKLWNFSGLASGAAAPQVTLEDDCATLQVIIIAGNGTAPAIYMPTNPPPGKQITFRVELVAQIGASNGNNTTINIYDSGTKGGTATAIANISASQSITFAYCPQLLGLNVTTPSCWLNVEGGSSVFTAQPNSMAVSGTNNRILNGSQNAFIGGGSGNYILVSGGSAIVGGYNHTISNASGYNYIGGGAGNTINAGGGYCTIAGGYTCAINSGVTFCNFLGGGYNNTLTGVASSMAGGSQGNDRGISGAFVLASHYAPIANASGVQQARNIQLGRQTTNATATVLSSDGNAAATANQIILPNNSAFYIRGEVVATVTGGGNTSVWTFSGVLKRGATAASTSLVNSVAFVSTLVAQDSGASSWVLALTADTTNGGLAITVTGQASTTIRWTANCYTTEVTY